MMWVSRVWRTAIVGAGVLMAAGITNAGPAAIRQAQPVFTLIVEPPTVSTVHCLVSPIQGEIATDRPAVPAIAEPPVSFTPASVEEIFAAPTLNGMPAGEPIAASLPAEPLSVPIAPFGAAGLMGLGGVMYWFGAKWLRVKA